MAIEYGVTDAGFVIKPLAVILTEIDDDMRANINPGLDLDARSLQGMVNGIMAGAFAELWELGLATYGAAYPDSADDASLDNVSSLTGTKRSPNTKTTIADVSVTLSPSKPLPANSVASLIDQPNARFLSDVEVPADPVGGTFLVNFTAETAGALTALPNQLKVIAQPVSGWTQVNNLTAGVTGEQTETDSALRAKRIAELEGGGSTNINSIRANLLLNTTAIDAAVLQNVTDLVDANGLTPHSVRCILDGGDPEAIAQSIFDTIAAGIATNGVQSEDVLDSQGNIQVIKFDFATQLTYFLDATVTTDPLTYNVTSGETNMELAVQAYVNALRIGGDVIVDQVKCALLSIAGVVAVPVFAHGFSAAPVQTTDLAVAIDERATSLVTNINLDIPGVN